MTRAPRSESELSTLRKRALELASLRKERPTTVHLLAAIAGKLGPAQDLLATRNLDEETLLKAGRSFDEALADPIELSLAHARDVAKRARGPVSTDESRRGQATISPDSKITHLEPNALHLLVSLLSERQLAAHRALSLTGIDTTRLRTAALALALGVVPPRRILSAPATPDAVPVSRSSFATAAQPAPSSHPGARGIARLGAPRVVPFSQHPASGPRRPSSPPKPAPLIASKLATSPELTSPAAAEQTPLEPPVEKEKRPGTLRSLRAATLAPTKIVGREDEIAHAVDTMMKHAENGVVLVGASGVGKSAIIRALAAPLAARGRALVAIEPGVFLASAPRGALADKLAEIFEELRSSGNPTVLFIDDVHDLLTASDDLTTELKTQLARGDVGFVSATTPDQHRKLIEADPQLARRFNAIHVEEPDEEDAFLMVEAAIAPVAKHHGVTFSPGALAAAVSFTIRYLPGRSLPEKAISTLDLAAARSKRVAPKDVLTEDDVALALAMEVDVPPARMLERDIDRMLSLESHLGERIVGHDTSVSVIAGHLRKSAAGLRGARPLGSFLLLGPTGVGKTETAKAVADVLFGSPDAMTRIDLSEYGESHSVARLLGAPPGYVGHEAGGQLTEAVRRRAYQVILLDEVEKAHTDVLLAFLQVLDEGHLTDGRGRRVDFKNTIIFATSNLGSRDVAEALSGRSVGFSGRSRSTGNLAEKAITTAKRSLPIELFNRFDEVLFFAPLEPDEVRGIAKRLLGGLASMLRQKDMRLDVDDRAIEVLMESGGYQPELGARPMRRAIARLIESPIADMLIRGDLKPGMAALVGEENGEISVDAVYRTDPSAVPPPVRERAQLRA